MSLRTRFTLLTTAIVTLIVIIISGAFYIVFANKLRSDLDTEIIRRVEAFSKIPIRPRSGLGFFRGGIAEPPGSGAQNVFSIGHLEDGAQIALSSNIAATDITVPKEVWRNANSNSPQVTTVTNNGQDYSLAILRLSEPTNLPTANTTVIDEVAFGESLNEISSTLSNLRNILLITDLTGILLAAIGGWLISQQAIKPINRLAKEISGLGHDKNLSQRLAPTASSDEINVLTLAFNDSLDRIQSLLKRQQQFVADASHELRTPLTTIRTDIEVLSKHASLPEKDRKRLLDHTTSELKRLSQLVTDLLTLARADVESVIHRRSINWDETINAAINEGQSLIAPRKIHYQKTGGLGVGTGDLQAIKRVWGIIFENTVHHTPDTAEVWVQTLRNENEIEIVYEDSGNGVADDLLPNLFHRFFQADNSRHTEGVGLGLAIAQSLVAAHDGKIVASRSQHGGLKIDVVMLAG